MNPTLRRAVLSAAALLLLGSASAAHAGDFGVRAGYYFDFEEPFIGAEYLTRVAPRIYFNPNFEYVLVGDGLTYMTINGDFHYDFPTRGSTYVWAGAGLALVRFDLEGPDNSDTDPALNLFGGVGWRRGGVTPYVQAKVIVDGGNEFVLAFGLRF